MIIMYGFLVTSKEISMDSPEPRENHLETAWIAIDVVDQEDAITFVVKHGHSVHRLGIRDIEPLGQCGVRVPGQSSPTRLHPPPSDVESHPIRGAHLELFFVKLSV